METSIVDASAAEVVSRPTSEGSERHGIDELPVIQGNTEGRRYGNQLDIGELIENANRLHQAILENGTDIKF